MLNLLIRAIGFYLFFDLIHSTHDVDLYPITHLEMPKDLYMHIRLNDIFRKEEKLFLKVIDLNDDISLYELFATNDACKSSLTHVNIKDSSRKCPDRCNANPCLYIENAFEHSCYSEYWKMKPSKQSFLFGKYDGSVFVNVDTTTAESVFEAIFNYKSNSLWNNIYKCECFRGYEWVEDDYNDTGGKCVPIEIVNSKCEDVIECVTGHCVTINHKHICKFRFFVEGGYDPRIHPCK
jgi:hypothetical protein